MNLPWIIAMIVGVGFGTATVASLVVAIRSRRIRRLSWSIRSNTLIRGRQPTLPDLTIRYRNQQLDNLTVSGVIFWNDGNQTIDRTDIADNDPLRVETAGGVKLLAVNVLASTSDPSPFNHTEDADRGKSMLDFEFMAPNRGVVLQIIHSGTSSGDLSVKGFLKDGGRPGQRKIYASFLHLPTSVKFDLRFNLQTRRRINLALGFVYAMPFLGLGSFLAVSGHNAADTLGDRVPSYVLGIIAAAGGIAVYVISGFAYLRARIPPGLEIYGQDLEKGI